MAAPDGWPRWIPHSVLALPRQRPARSSFAPAVPCRYRAGTRSTGNPRRPADAAAGGAPRDRPRCAPGPQPSSGLTLMRPLAASKQRQVRPRPRPDSACGRKSRRHRARGRRRAALPCGCRSRRSVSAIHSAPAGSAAARSEVSRTVGDGAGQAERLQQSVAIGQGRRKELAGVEKDHGQGPVDVDHHGQQHGAVGPRSSRPG